jgi:DNA-binding MarR family transcriptional regulator
MASASDTASKTAVDVAARLRLAVTRTARRLRQEAGPGLSPTLLAALATIERHGPITPSDLAAAERVQRPTATRVVTRLEEQDLAERRDDPRDGRSCFVSVTPRGAALLKEQRNRKTAFLAARLDDLPADDIQALDRAAEILERVLEDDRA